MIGKSSVKYMLVKDFFLLQSDLDGLTKWSCLNNLKINDNKCFYILPFLKETINLKICIPSKTAGYPELRKPRPLDSQLDFRNHIQNMTNSVFRSVGFEIILHTSLSNYGILLNYI